MNKRRKSRIGLIILVLLLIVISPILISQQRMLNLKKAQMNEVNNRILQETKLNEDLQHQVDILDSDEYNAKVAREKLGMVKPGDKIFVDVNK